MDRFVQVEARAKASERLSAQIQAFLQVANSPSDEFTHLSDEERNTVRGECEDALNWMNMQMNKQNNLAQSADPILTSAMIDDQTLALKKKCTPITTKPKVCFISSSFYTKAMMMHEIFT